MNAHDFSMWLNGFVEMNPNAMPTQTQWQIIKDHLALVFKKETLNRYPDIKLPAIPTPYPLPTIEPIYKPYKLNPFITDNPLPIVTC